VFKIGRLAELSGFEPTLLRAWERRHGLLEPGRLENGYRVYTNQDLAVLMRVRELLAQGASIGDVARMGRKALLHEATGGLSTLPDADLLDGRHPDVAWAILDAMPCAVLVTDTMGLVRWANRGVLVLCGYDLSELHGLAPGKMLQGPATEATAVAALREGIAQKRPVTVNITNYTKDGVGYIALVDIGPIFSGPRHIGFVGTARLVQNNVGRRV
jgi:PAS domain S-box-containing protein